MPSMPESALRAVAAAEKLELEAIGDRLGAIVRAGPEMRDDVPMTPADRGDLTKADP